MKRLCTICARAGSKGVRSKNTRLLAGKPLIAHSLAQARSSGLFDAIAVSSDSDHILAIARSYGATCLVRRPEALASDAAAKLPAIAHCLEQAEAQLGTRFDIKKFHTMLLGLGSVPLPVLEEQVHQFIATSKATPVPAQALR